MRWSHGFSGDTPRVRNRTVLSDYYNGLYKERNLVERLFRVLHAFPSGDDSARQDALFFLSYIQLAASYLWLN